MGCSFEEAQKEQDIRHIWALRFGMASSVNSPLWDCVDALLAQRRNTSTPCMDAYGLNFLVASEWDQ